MRLGSALALTSIGLVTVMAGVDCSSTVVSKFTASAGSGMGGGSGIGAGGSMSIGIGGGFNNPSTGAGIIGPGNNNAYVTQPICAMGACTDFPQTPISADTGVPANAATLFGAATNFTAPTAATPLCVLEPQLSAGTTEGAMMPANWVEPRFRVNATGLNLFEIRITSPWEKYPLVVYSTKPEWYMPKSIWSGTLDVDAGLPSGTGLGNNAAQAPLTVTVRGINTATTGMTPVGVTGDFNIAPVVATGSLVFWTVNSAQVTPTSSQLFGFKVGDEGVQPALTLQQVAWADQPGEDGAELRGFYSPLTGFNEGQVQCMGCHAGTPDGSAVVFTDNWSWVKGAALLPGAAGVVAGAVPTTFNATDVTTPGTFTFGAGAQSMFRTPWWGTQSMSLAHWKAGDAIVVSSYGTSFQGAPPAFTTGTKRTTPWEALPYYDTANAFLDEKVNYHTLAWIDMESTATIDVNFVADPSTMNGYGQTLTTRQMEATAAEGTAWGLIATGDTMSDVMPSMSNLAATDTIAYVESDFTPDGHPDYTATQASIRTVAYNGHLGGASQLLAGASDSGHLNYYPSYSANDELIAFTQAPAPNGTTYTDGPYYNRFGQVMIVPAAGGMAIPLAANTPNACAGDDVSLGIINSWPKWSPDVVVHPNGKTYYFLIFSSARNYGSSASNYGDEFSVPFQLPANPASDFSGLHSSSQLYLAAIVVDNTTKEVTTYPAVYIWNQSRTPGAGPPNPPQQHSNLTPAWAPFALPPLVIPHPPSTN
jgi:hypothetical protein